MSEAEDPELDYSPLCGRIQRDGTFVDIHIYRLAGKGDPWSLEVVDHEGSSTVWNELFPTDRAAYREFYQTMEQDGIRSFVDAPGEALH